MSTLPAMHICGIEHTFFQWSLLKLAPASAIALHVAAVPLAKITLSHSRYTIPPLSVAALFVFGLVVDRVAPMNPIALFQGLVALLLKADALHFQAQQDITGQLPSSGADLLQSIFAFGASYYLKWAFGTSLFGETEYEWHWTRWVVLPVALFAFYAFGKKFAPSSPHEYGALSVVSALVFSALVAGIRERIVFFDVLGMTAGRALVFWSLQKEGGSERAARENEAAKHVPGTYTNFN